VLIIKFKTYAVSLKTMYEVMILFFSLTVCNGCSETPDDF